MILRANHGTDDLPVGEGKQRRFLPLHKLFDNDACSRLAEGIILHDCIYGIECLLLRHGNNDALPCGKTVCLDNDWRALFANICACRFCLSKDFVTCRWNPILLHEILCEGF